MADPNATNLYEGLFLMSASAMSGDLSGATEHVQGILDRVEAETLSLGKWEERKLAYPIEGEKRGTFLITYFNARPSQIANIERDCNLSEQVSRVMMTRCDYMGESELKDALEGKKAVAEVEAATAEAPTADAPAAEAEAAPAASE